MRLLLPILLLVALASAQIFGPAGVPLSWDFGILYFNTDTLAADVLVTSLNAVFSGYMSADSVEADHGLFGVNLSSALFKSPAGTQTFTMVGDTLRFNMTGGAADRDWTLKMVNSVGDAFRLTCDDGANEFAMNANLRVTSNVYASYGLFTSEVGSASGTWRIGLGGTGEILFKTNSSRPDLTLDPNDSGSGDINLGVTGDSDSLFSFCVYNSFNGTLDTDQLTFDSMLGFVREVTEDYTIQLTDWQIVVTDTLNLTLPALSAAYDSLSPLTGNGFQVDVKLTADAPCTLFCAGADSLDDDVSIALARWDNLRLRAVHDRWILR